MKKLLVTLGPSSMNKGTIAQLDPHDIYVYRINMSHTSIETLEEQLALIQSSTGVPVCIDSEGAQIRSGVAPGGSVDYQKGALVRIPFERCESDPEALCLTPVGIAAQFKPGDVINVDFNLAQFKVVGMKSDHCLVEVVRGGAVGNNKAADIDRPVILEPITEKDIQAVALGRKMGVEHFALSFANTGAGVKKMRELAGPKATIISKIESRMALTNLREIAEATDELLIDRGDLSRSVPLDKIPFVQRRVISLARIWECPVFIATNLLESMLTRAEPTRAEVNDIVSTILMGGNGLVLAAETAVGEYPVEAAAMTRSLMNNCGKWTSNTALDEILEM
ncbi:MAG: pyruvate kinase [Pseudodesulfovibrio sp.]